MKKAIILSFLLCCTTAFSFKIDRAIVSSDANPLYLDFWPIVAKAWHRLGIRPTLALIADETVQVDETIGDVIRFKPIPGISNGFQAQVIRLLLPTLFENEISIISDIDMIPISKEYFIDLVSKISDNMFVIYRDKAVYEWDKTYPMCYVAAKGSTFKEVFRVNSANDLPSIICEWSQLFDERWNSDESLLYQYTNDWRDYQSRCMKLGLRVERRIDRPGNWYNKNLLIAGYYIDCHSERPYSDHKKEIDELFQLVESI